MADKNVNTNACKNPTSSSSPLMKIVKATEGTAAPSPAPEPRAIPGERVPSEERAGNGDPQDQDVHPEPRRAAPASRPRAARHGTDR